MDSGDLELGKLSGVVVVMGACGSGKSSLGKYIANSCSPHSVFIEGDDFHPIQNVSKMSQGTNQYR